MSLDAILDPATLDLTDSELDLAQYQPGDEHCAEAQAAGIMLRTGEEAWPWDVSFGLPYVQLFVKDGTDDDTIAGVIRSKLLERPGIASIESVTLLRNPGAKSLGFTVRALTTSGRVVQLTT